jgi:hypothetical protein
MHIKCKFLVVRRMYALSTFSLSCKLESELRNLFIPLPWNVYTLSISRLIGLSFVVEVMRL